MPAVCSQRDILTSISVLYEKLNKKKIIVNEICIKIMNEEMKAYLMQPADC